MATRLRKTRKYRGSRNHGWGQVGQHRASGHRGGLGVSGQLKHHYSSMLANDPDHFGHSSTRPPVPNVTRRWAAVRDLDDLYAKYGSQSGEKMIINLKEAGYEKLLGGGSVNTPYTVIVHGFTKSAAAKVSGAGGEVLTNDG